MTFWMMIIGIGILFAKFLGDMLSKIPFMEWLFPIIRPIANLGILYPIGFAILLHPFHRNIYISSGILIAGSLLVYLAGISLI